MLCSAIFHHSDARLPPRLERALARVIITPSIHWVHHHAMRADTDSNYGTIFSFWDPLFRSQQPHPALADHADRGRGPPRSPAAAPDHDAVLALSEGAPRELSKVASVLRGQ